MPGYAIMRTAKIKTAGNLSASIEHTFRERPTPNADLKRTNLNQHFGAQNGKELREKIAAMIPAKRRKDAVLCIEHFIGASPEWWDRASKKDLEEFFKRSHEWLKETYGKQNVAYFGTQLDELTPHAVAYVVPLRENSLNAKSWLGGKERLRALQTSFAVAVESLGLERGIEGSRAKHERVERFYGNLQSVDREIEQRTEQSTKAITLPERVQLAAGKMPASITRELEYAADAIAKARYVKRFEGPRREAAGYARGQKELPAERERLVSDRKQMEGWKADLYRQYAALQKHRDEQKVALETEARQAKEQLELSAEKMAREREMLEQQKAQIKRTVLRELGIELAQRGREYVGLVLKSTYRSVLQITDDVGLVMHEVDKWAQDVKHFCAEAAGKKLEITISHDRSGNVEARAVTDRDRQLLHERVRSQSRGLER